MWLVWYQKIFRRSCQFCMFEAISEFMTNIKIIFKPFKYFWVLWPTLKSEICFLHSPCLSIGLNQVPSSIRRHSNYLIRAIFQIRVQNPESRVKSESVKSVPFKAARLGASPHPAANIFICKLIFSTIFSSILNNISFCKSISSTIFFAN